MKKFIKKMANAKGNSVVSYKVTNNKLDNQI